MCERFTLLIFPLEKSVSIASEIEFSNSVFSITKLDLIILTKSSEKEFLNLEFDILISQL